MTKHAGKMGMGIGVMVALVLAGPWDARAAGDAEAHAQASASAPGLSAGSSVHAVLESKLDARSAKVGDAVKARATRAVKSGESVVLPRGSKLLGRVSTVQAGAGASAHGESKLGVSFDRAVLPDGKEVAVDLAIQAIAAAETEVPATRARPSHAMESAQGARSTPRGSGGLLGGVTGEVLGDAPDLDAGIASDVAIGTDAELGRALDVDGALSTSSEGVFGLKGLQLESTGKSSVLVRTGGPVTLPSGTRMLLRARGEVSAH